LAVLVDFEVVLSDFGRFWAVSDSFGKFQAILSGSGERHTLPLFQNKFLQHITMSMNPKQTKAGDR